MSDLVQLTKDNDIAIITINNPPVNALSPGVPEGIAEAIEQIDKDASVKAAVLIGGGKTFIAGADIAEFGKITSGKRQGGVGLVPILARMEDCTKPVVMAIHGQAFGGAREACIEPAIAMLAERIAFIKQHDVIPLRPLRLVDGERVAIVELVRLAP